jgi:hypothetical protein
MLHSRPVAIQAGFDETPIEERNGILASKVK